MSATLIFRVGKRTFCEHSAQPNCKYSPLNTPSATWNISHRLKHKALENLRRKSWNRDPGQAAQCPKHRFFRVLRDGSHATMCYTPHEPTLVYVRLLRYSNDAIRPLTTYIRGTPYEEWCHQIPYRRDENKYPRLNKYPMTKIGISENE